MSGFLLYFCFTLKLCFSWWPTLGQCCFSDFFLFHKISSQVLAPVWVWLHKSQITLRWGSQLSSFLTIFRSLKFKSKLNKNFDVEHICSLHFLSARQLSQPSNCAPPSLVNLTLSYLTQPNGSKKGHKEPQNFRKVSNYNFFVAIFFIRIPC